MRRYLLPAGWVVLGLIWGSSFLWIKIAIGEIPPATLVAWRMTLGAAGLVTFLVASGRRLPSARRDLAKLAVLGLINTALPIFLISWGEQFIDSGTAAVFNSLAPLFSLLLAGMVLKTEPVTGLRISGVLIGFGGAALLASREFALRADSSALIGTLAVAVAAASYAAGGSYARHSMRGMHRYEVAAGSLVFAAIYAWTLALVADGGVILPTQPGPIIAVLWLGLIGSFIAYLIYFLLIERLGATVAAMVTYTFPVVGVALGVVFLGEVLDLRLAVGAGLVLAGIVVAALRYDARVRSPAGRGAE
jgi:drug/metabolite transporter (DMT)-like permease